MTTESQLAEIERQRQLAEQARAEGEQRAQQASQVGQQNILNDQAQAAQRIQATSNLVGGPAGAAQVLADKALAGSRLRGGILRDGQSQLTRDQAYTRGNMDSYFNMVAAGVGQRGSARGGGGGGGGGGRGGGGGKGNRGSLTDQQFLVGQARARQAAAQQKYAQDVQAATKGRTAAQGKADAAAAVIARNKQPRQAAGKLGNWVLDAAAPVRNEALRRKVGSDKLQQGIEMARTAERNATSGRREATARFERERLERELAAARQGINDTSNRMLKSAVRERYGKDLSAAQADAARFTDPAIPRELQYQDAAGRISPEAYARQIAVEEYGFDPAEAYGLIQDPDIAQWEMNYGENQASQAEAEAADAARSSQTYRKWAIDYTGASDAPTKAARLNAALTALDDPNLTDEEYFAIEQFLEDYATGGR